MTRRSPNLVASIALASVLAIAGCKLDTAPPRVGPKAGSGPPPAGLVVRLVEASVDPDRRVAAMLEITKDDVPLDAAAVAALRPALTLAGLATEPVSKLSAWRSYLLVGAQRIATLPLSPPGTPAASALALLDQQQPGAEPAVLEDLGLGRFRHVFATPLSAEYRAGETLRVGVFMQAVAGTPAATATLDFVAGGGTPATREVVVDAGCASCHGTVRGHGATRIGTRICVTCHTYQAVDPDTMDPAALATATRLTDPNPLEFGRLVHRIHRGKNLPTLYAASSSAPAPVLPSDTALPLPFYPGRSGLTPVAGRKFSVIGDASHERVFAEVVVRSTLAGVARAPEVAGIYYPRDYRDCAVCHAGAADQAVALTGEVSRRSCHGCHADVWFGAFIGTLDGVHFAHPGGPQGDDLGCRECHVRSAVHPDPLAPLDQVHQAPLDRLAANLPQLEVLEVRDLRPGARPTIVFRVRDQHGLITSLDAPVPAIVPEVSPVPRALWSPPTPPNVQLNSTLSFLVGGPFAGGGAEYGYRLFSTITWPRSETVPVATLADAQGNFTYTFVEAIPESATGAWTVVFTGRRNKATTPYDLVTKRFAWPYTGETVSETAIQTVVHVDTGTGTWAAGDPAPASARRTVVDQVKCEACHKRLAFHGGTRNSVVGCLLCHTPERTDWNQRPKDVVSGNVDLAATYDGLEEQSIHFKVMIHRLHTGSGQGTAALERFEPYVVHGNGKRPFFFGEGTIPAELRRCDLCHLDGTWRLEALPEGAGVTTANETSTLRHEASVLHGDEPVMLPGQAACVSCHGNAFAAPHAARNTVGGEESCIPCHGARGTKSVDKVHGLVSP